MNEKSENKYIYLIATKFTADGFRQVEDMTRARYFGNNRSAYMRSLVERDVAEYNAQQSTRETK